VERKLGREKREESVGERNVGREKRERERGRE